LAKDICGNRSSFLLILAYAFEYFYFFSSPTKINNVGWDLPAQGLVVRASAS